MMSEIDQYHEYLTINERYKVRNVYSLEKIRNCNYRTDRRSVHHRRRIDDASLVSLDCESSRV